MLIKKDIKIAQSIASKDAVIHKLRQDVQSLTQSLKDQKEDTKCLLFAHWQCQRDSRNSKGSMIDAKKDTIKRLHAKIVDQGEMCYNVIDKVNDHNRTAQLMKKRADEATKL
jgi:hypothetical protein